MSAPGRFAPPSSSPSPPLFNNPLSSSSSPLLFATPPSFALPFSFSSVSSSSSACESAKPHCHYNSQPIVSPATPPLPYMSPSSSALPPSASIFTDISESPIVLPHNQSALLLYSAVPPLSSPRYRHVFSPSHVSCFSLNANPVHSPSHVRPYTPLSPSHPVYSPSHVPPLPLSSPVSSPSHVCFPSCSSSSPPASVLDSFFTSFPSQDRRDASLAFASLRNAIPPSPTNPYTPLQLASLWLSEQFSANPFIELGDPAYLYKKVANKTRPVATTLPENFRIVRHEHPAPLANLQNLPVHPPDFVPRGRFTRER